MADRSPASQRRGKAARKAARRDAEKDVTANGAHETPRSSSSMLPAVVPGQAQQAAQTDPAVAPAPQNLPVLVSPCRAAEVAPNGNRGKVMRALAFGGAAAAALVLAFAGMFDGSTTEPVPPLAHVATSTAAVETAPPSPIKHKTNETRNNAPVKKTDAATPKPQARSGNIPATVRTGKQDMPNKKKNQTAQAAKTPEKITPATRIASAPQQGDILQASTSPVAQNRYAQCLELPGFLRREQCKWQVCNGNWGKDGCPSYKKDDVEVNS